MAHVVPRPGHDWNLDGVINTGDEYIELLNHGVIDVNLMGPIHVMECFVPEMVRAGRAAYV